MNTGLRRGEVVKLRWGSVDFNRRLLTVEGRNTKNRQTRHVPLNNEAVSVLRNWREQSGTGAHVFDVATGFRTAWERVLKRARVGNFRWHDLRHHFASRLVQHGVPLNTVRDLLGHSSVGMSLRYAHLAPDQRREAVAKLDETGSGAQPALEVGRLFGSHLLLDYQGGLKTSAAFRRALISASENTWIS